MTLKQNISAVPAKIKSKRSMRGRPTLENVVAIENKLLDVALNEFLQHGYGGASMNRIVQAASMSKTTLYSRYPSKEALFRAIIHAQIDRLSASTVLKSN